MQIANDLFQSKAPATADKKTSAPLESQVDETDLIYPLVALLSTKKSCSIAVASHHPFINFLVKRRERMTEEEQRSFIKFISHLENFLAQCNDNDELNAFFSYFASKQGLILFRCPILTLRYFGKMTERLSSDKNRFLNIFTVLSYPILLTCTDRYDQIIQQVLSDEKIGGLDENAMNAFVQKLAKGEVV